MNIYCWSHRNKTSFIVYSTNVYINFLTRCMITFPCMPANLLIALWSPCFIWSFPQSKYKFHKKNSYIFRIKILKCSRVEIQNYGKLHWIDLKNYLSHGYTIFCKLQIFLEFCRDVSLCSSFRDSPCILTHSQRKLFEILLIQTEIRLLLPFTK